MRNTVYFVSQIAGIFIDGEIEFVDGRPFVESLYDGAALEFSSLEAETSWCASLPEVQAVA